MEFLILSLYPLIAYILMLMFLQIMEHPHTVLLGKVIQANIALGNAHINRAGRSKIISRLMDLQQSVNVLFDSKTASGEFIPLFYVCCATFKQCYYKQSLKAMKQGEVRARVILPGKAMHLI